MKRIFGVLAAGILVATPFYAAHAQDGMDSAKQPAAAAAPAEAATTTMGTAAATEATAPAATAERKLTLMDGSAMMVGADMMAFVMDATGNKVAAQDGDHILADGKVLTVKDGKVTAGMPADDSAKQPEAAAPAAAPAADAPKGDAAKDGAAD